MATAAMVPAAAVAIIARAVRAGVGRREEQEVEDEEQWHLVGGRHWSRAAKLRQAKHHPPWQLQVWISEWKEGRFI
jgi:hypothetical protein